MALTSNQRSGMILEVQIQIFGVRTRSASRRARQSFNFQNINIFCENRHEASFYIKEQMQKTIYEFKF